MAGETETLNQKLAVYLLSYRTTPHTTTNTTPSELFLNKTSYKTGYGETPII